MPQFPVARSGHDFRRTERIVAHSAAQEQHLDLAKRCNNEIYPLLRDFVHVNS